MDAGEDDRRLPAPLQRPALLVRNVLRVMRSYRETALTGANPALRVHAARGEWPAEVYMRLALGVQYVCEADVEGDVAEFGTMTGRTAATLAKALAIHDHYRPERRRLHLFDSFAGLPTAEALVDREAPHVRAGVWGAGTCHGITSDDLRKKCAAFLPEERIVIHAGWFNETLPRIGAATRFALIHMDCDLYQSAMDVLNHVFEGRLASDGMALFFDDWNPNHASPEFGERRAWREVAQRFGVQYSDSGEYGWGGRKLIVHSYGGPARPVA